MKYCAYCGAKNKTSAEACRSCGADKFRFVCENCGTEFEKAQYCPACGVKAGRAARTCPECGERYFSRACPECGYTHVRQQDHHAGNVRTSRSSSRMGFGTVLLWIFFLPIMAGIAIWRSRWAVKYKVIGTAALVLVCLLFSFGSPAEEEPPAVDNLAAADTTPAALIDDKTAAHAATETASPIVTPAPTPEFIAFVSGQYKVGVDMPAGEYIIAADTSRGGYIEVSSDANGDDIIYNAVFDTGTIATVQDGEYFKMSGCSAVLGSDFWAKYTIDAFKPGVMVKVGIDIPAGEYRVTAADGEEGYYCVYSDSRHDDIITNGFAEPSAYVEVEEGQYLELSSVKLELT